MMKENEGFPDIEQLGHDEFNLDSEEQQRLQAEGEAKVQEVGLLLGKNSVGNHSPWPYPNCQSRLHTPKVLVTVKFGCL